jgi:hypothetical protein
MSKTTREKRDRSCKPRTFVPEEEEVPQDYCHISAEMMFEFLEKHRDLKLTLRSGSIDPKYWLRKDKKGKPCIIRCCFEYFVDTPDNQKLDFDVHFKLDNKGRCPFRLSPPNSKYANLQITYVVYVALTTDLVAHLPHQFIIELIEVEPGCFNIHNLFRKSPEIVEELMKEMEQEESYFQEESPSKKQKEFSAEIQLAIKKEAEKLFLERDPSIREEALLKLADDFKQQAKKEYEAALAENRRLLSIEIESEKKKGFQELRQQIQQARSEALSKMSELTAENFLIIKPLKNN